ncbi:MAG TPA: hypothetical protein VLL51_00910 [Gemmatimonadales bacterium]|nr:hypothetical protein [Gemmatimonadales bacterium]
MNGARSLTASVVAILLVATAVVSVWLVATSGVFASAGPGLEGPLPGAPGTIPPLAVTGEGLGLASAYQVAQPRDPFAPLTQSTTTTSSTVPGETTTTTVPGQTTTTEPGATTTTDGFQPEVRRIVLLEIRDENGVRKAVVTVDGETYIVGVGETFAENFRVVSLGESSGVFQYGDSAFTLAVGQAILK